MLNQLKKKGDAARESTPPRRTAIEDPRARAYGSEKPEARAIQRAIYGHYPGPFTWQTRRAVPMRYQTGIERFLVNASTLALGRCLLPCIVAIFLLYGGGSHE